MRNWPALNSSARSVAAMFVALAPLPSVAQTSMRPITEVTATWGRGGPYSGDGSSSVIGGLTAVADLGGRWVLTSGTTLGFSFLGGWDDPQEAGIGGVRLRIGRSSGKSMFEGHIAAVWSSLSEGSFGTNRGFGMVLGVAFYPEPWGALVGQVETIPRYGSAESAFQRGTLNRRPALSAGPRLAGRLAVAVGLIGGIAGALAGGW